ncbi:MAG: winged helix-turn-helix domain-containing protein, partial [Alphaproteobacteria bacterium]|nr:winged helix-turn-helix domain-containing protein [Alphaproteobacteria bacterium]
CRMDEEVFAFGSFQLVPAQRTLFEDGKPVRLGGRALDILVILTERAGDTISKEELITRAWPETVVEEAALRVHVAALRKALGDGRAGKRYIANHPGRGYAFIAPVIRENALSATAAPTAMAGAGNLPALLTRVVGRDGVISRLAHQLVRRRFVTIVGPGGIGKTTVAVAVADGVRASYGDGAWFVELASLSDPDLVPSTLCALLGITASGSNPLSGLIAWLRDKHILIVIDSCEHVIDAAAALTEALLKAAPRAGILATSREPLRAEGEWLHRLAPLELPPQEKTFPAAAEALGYSAVELFNERATATTDSFVLSDAEVPAVLEICRRLDGVPLALELAAARVDTFGVSGLAARLDDRFGVLTSGRRTALPRQQTLRATIDWSYELLPEAEQVILRRLAVFRGAFTMVAAVAVVVDKRIRATDAIEGIANLAEKSLLTTDITGDITYHRLLDTTRLYALLKLAEGGEIDSAQRRHASYFRDCFALPASSSGSGLSNEELTRRVREIDDVRAALDWSFSPPGDIAISVDLTAAYAPVWLHLSLMQECRERCERALQGLAPRSASQTPLKMWLQIGLGNSLLHTRGPSEQAQTVLTKALQSAEALGDLRAQLRVLLDLASVIGFRGEYARAAAVSERAGAIARQIGDTAGVVLADRRMGMILLRLGRLAEAQRCFERVIQTAPSYQNKDRLPSWRYSDDRAMARALLARVLWLRGFLERAHHEAQASLGQVRGSDHQLTICRLLLYGMGRIAPMTGDFAAAETAISSILEAATSAAAPFWTMVGQFLRGKLLVERKQFAEGLAVLREAFDIGNQAGWRLSYPEFMGSLALALAGLRRLDEAHDAVCRAIEAAGGTEDGEQWYVPELLRIKGEVLLQQAGGRSTAAAEDCFSQAREMAREQGALFWELRAALSAARLSLRQKNRAAAAQVLQPVYDRFTEGFNTADLKAAKLLLEAFNGHLR